MTGEPDFIRANKKITEATDWRGDVNVSLGEDTVTFQHRLLNENEFLDLKKALNLSEVEQDGDENVGQTESQERLLELQQKEELDDEEEEELRELAREVAGQEQEIEDALGDDGYAMLMDMGRAAIKPSEEDIGYFYDNPTELHQYADLAELPNPLTKDTVEEILENELESMITDQPYPIKLNVGMQAFAETISVLGNGPQE